MSGITEGPGLPPSDASQLIAAERARAKRFGCLLWLLLAAVILVCAVGWPEHLPTVVLIGVGAALLGGGLYSFIVSRSVKRETGLDMDSQEFLERLRRLRAIIDGEELNSKKSDVGRSGHPRRYRFTANQVGQMAAELTLDNQGAGDAWLDGIRALADDLGQPLGPREKERIREALLHVHLHAAQEVLLARFPARFEKIHEGFSEALRARLKERPEAYAAALKALVYYMKSWNRILESEVPKSGESSMRPAVDEVKTEFGLQPSRSESESYREFLFAGLVSERVLGLARGRDVRYAVVLLLLLARLRCDWADTIDVTVSLSPD